MIDLSKNRIRNNILKVGSKNLNSENWEVYHPDGTHMFTCGEKKATWYLERNLAVRTADGKIMLLFEPKGNGFDTNEIFGKSIRETICVVTGNQEGLQRHHIVPYCYRSYFPEAFKTKNHHDVVLINYIKHSEYEVLATQYKDEIATMFGVKTIGEFNIEYTSKLREFGKANGIILNNIHSLFKTYGKITPEIRIEKLKQISEGTGIPLKTVLNYNYIQLYKLYNLLREVHINEQNEFKQKYRYLYDHGYHVVKQLDTDEKIVEFVKMWRNHFIETMNPQFMPTGWSVDFRTKTKI
jgi:hypothetical protein